MASVEGTAVAGNHHDHDHQVPCASAEKFAVGPATVESMHRRLDLILEACEHLQGFIHNQNPVTQREVLKLRKAYWVAIGEAEKLLRCSESEDSLSTRSNTVDAVPQDEKAVACDRALGQLEEYVNPRPAAHTFDEAGARAPKTGEDSNSTAVREKRRRWWEFFRIPLERRLQTLVISIFLFFTFIPCSIALMVMLLLNWWTMPLMLGYLVYIQTIGRPRHPLRRYPAFARLKIWNYFRNYFPVRLVVPREVRPKFNPNQNYLFLYHPHGIHGFGAVTAFSLDPSVDVLLPGLSIHVQTLRINFFVPFWRELISYSGSGDASARCIRRTLSAGPGESVVLVVGGARESLLASPNTNELNLQGRKGFVKIALQEGSPLVPVYGFGENDVYRIPRMARSKSWKRLVEAFRKISPFELPLFVGRGWFNYNFGVIPHRRPITVVVGAPLQVPKIPDPTPEDLQEWHGKYVAALRHLFDEYRAVYDVDTGDLRIH